MAKTTSKPTGADLLKSLGAKATRAPAAKKDDRWVIHPDPSLEPMIGEYLQLAVVQGDLKPLVDQRKGDITNHLFDQWSERLWQTGVVPANPRILIKKRDAYGKETGLDDMSCIFQVKFRTDGLQKLLPDAESMKPGQTAQDVLMEMLTSELVGLSEGHALELLNPIDGDIEVYDELDLAESMNKLFNSDDPTTKSAITKLMTYLHAEPSGKTDLVQLPAISAEESAKLLRTKQLVRLKDGFFERAKTYCRNLEELRKLIRWVNPTLMITNGEFAISDSKFGRAERLEETMTKFLTVSE